MIRLTQKMAIPNSNSPESIAITPPAHKSNAIKLVKFAKNFFSMLVCFFCANSFFPYCSKRLSASSCERPRILEPIR